jgi:DNA-binding PadR family transcriptional regulator
VSSIRLFILTSYAEHGEMHGHQVRLQAEQEHLPLWTDISVSGMYGAIKRLATEGLLEVVRSERDGNLPERQIYAITDAGRAALAALRHEGLSSIWFKPDPFDLALTRLDPAELDELPGIIESRTEELKRRLQEKIALNQRAAEYLTLGEKHALTHTEYRLRAEIAWHESLSAAAGEIIADEEGRHQPGATPDNR